MDTSAEPFSETYHRRNSSLSGLSIGDYSLSSSPQRSPSVTEPSSFYTLSSLSTLPTFSEPLGDASPSPGSSNIHHLQQLHNVLKEQNTLLQQLAAKAAVALERRGEPIPENYLQAISHKRRTSVAPSFNQRCISSSFLNSFPESAPMIDRSVFLQNRRHSLDFVSLSTDSRVESLEENGFGGYMGHPSQEDAYDSSPQLLTDSDVAVIQSLVYSKRVEFCAPVTDRDEFHPSIEELDDNFFNAALERNSLFPGCSSVEWKYCVPTFASRSTCEQSQTLRGCFPTIGGCPNYVPPWELWDHADGRSYHMDDRELIWPFERPDPLEFEIHDVPYSFSAPFPIRLNGESRLAKSGLTVGPGELSNSLGSLFGVPPDARIPLAFERNELRLLCDCSRSEDERPGERLDAYLALAQSYLRDLEDRGGTFLVRDFNFWMRTCSYHPANSRLFTPPTSFNSQPPHWTAVKPALLAEQQGFMATPTSHYIVTRSRLPVLERARQWYRLIYYQGLERKLDSVSRPSEAAKASWKTLLHDDENLPRLPPARRRMLLHAFERYYDALLSWTGATHCSKTSLRSQNDFETLWTPFCLSWLSLQIGGNESGWDVSTKDADRPYIRLGNLTFQRSAMSLLLLPHSTSHDAEAIVGPTEDDRLDYVEKGKYYWSLLVLTSIELETAHFEYPYTIPLQLVERAFQHLVSSWEEIAENILQEDHPPTILGTCSFTGTKINTDVEPLGPGAYLRPGVRLGHSELSALSAMIETTIREWSAFKRARVPLFCQHQEIYKDKYGACLSTIAAKPLDNEPAFDLHYKLDRDMIGIVTENIDSYVGRLRVLKNKLDKAAYVVRLEQCRKQTQKSVEAITASLMMTSVRDSPKALPPYLVYLKQEMMKVANQILNLRTNQVISFAIMSILVIYSFLYGYLLSAFPQLLS